MKSQKNFYAILSLAAVIFIDNIGFGLIFPILSPLLMDRFHGILGVHVSQTIRDFDFGLILASFSICMFFSAPILGDSSDQLGRKIMILFCLFGTVLAGIICAVAITLKTIFLLTIGRMVLGIFAGSQSIAQAAIADITSGKERTKTLGLIGAAGSAGFVIGPIIGGYFSDSAISSWFNYTTPFYLDSIISFGNMLLVYFLVPETYGVKKTLKLNFIKGIQIFSQAFKLKKIRQLSIILLLLELTFSLYFQFIGMYLMVNFNFSPIKLGLFLSLSGVIFTLTLGLLMRYLIKIASERYIILAGLIITCVGCIMPVFIKTALMQWVALFPIIIGNGIAYTALLSLFSQSVSENKQGWIMGITSSVTAMSWILGAVCASLFFYLHADLPYIMCVLFLVICLEIMFYIRR